MGKHLGLTRRNDLSWKTAEDVTAGLRVLDPEDPVRFDFALCHFGMTGTCPLQPRADSCARGACCWVRAGLAPASSVNGHGLRHGSGQRVEINLGRRQARRLIPWSPLGDQPVPRCQRAVEQGFIIKRLADRHSGTPRSRYSTPTNAG